MLLVSNVSADHRLDTNHNTEGLRRLNQVRSHIPSVTHIDYSARIQTVSHKTNPKFHALISQFYQQTGCPILVNTSFNVRGEPIVCSPKNAYDCFMGTEMDVLVIENCILLKNQQPADNKLDYKNNFELD